MCSSRTRSTRGVRQRRGDCPRSSATTMKDGSRSEEHTSELQSQSNLVCRLLLEKKNGACSFRDAEIILLGKTFRTGEVLSERPGDQVPPIGLVTRHPADPSFGANVQSHYALITI